VIPNQRRHAAETFNFDECARRYIPADHIETVNTPGQRLYGKQWEMQNISGDHEQKRETHRLSVIK